MGHLVGKDIYRKLGRKIDGLSTRAPWNQHLYAILKELYSSEEAEVVVRMPYGPATLEEIATATKMERDRLEKILVSLCDKGLVMDIHMHGAFRYIISPMVIGIFEFTMMRTGEGLNHKKWAHLFSDYLGSPDSLFAANGGKDMKVSPLRTLPHAEAIAEDTVEILDYEKATAIVDQAQKCAIGICSCRHEKLHLGEKQCEIPLESCLSFDSAADYLIRHNLARLAPKEEVLEQLAQSRERELVFNADNVQKQISFICQCCGCCCNVLGAINKYGFPHIVVTSNYIAAYDSENCLECGECAEACPIDAIAAPDGVPQIDEEICLGCGVCALRCATESMRLVERRQRVLHPEDTFEKIILQCLERGTLQNQMFADPNRLTHGFMRAVVGAFLKLPPVKKSLMSDKLRSSFLNRLRQH